MTKPSETRQAAVLLRRYGLGSYVSGRTLVLAAKEAQRGLGDTLRLVASLQMAGQGEGPAPEAKKIAMRRARRD